MVIGRADCCLTRITRARIEGERDARATGGRRKMLRPADLSPFLRMNRLTDAGGTLYGASGSEGDLGLYCELGTRVPAGPGAARAVEGQGLAPG